MIRQRLKAAVKAAVLAGLRTAFKVQELDTKSMRIDGEEVFDRFILFDHFGVQLRLHRLRCPVWPTVLHDHPWDFTSVILRGGYYEEMGEMSRGRTYMAYTTKPEWRGPGSVLTRKADIPHNVATLDKNRDSWSLVFRGRKYRDWGLWNRTTGYPEEVTPL